MSDEWEDCDINDERPSVLSGATSVDERFQLLSTLISVPESIPAGIEELRNLERLVRDDFRVKTSEIGIPGVGDVYADLLDLLDELHDVVDFPYLANKNVIAVCGEFSAGKSRFLNAIFGTDELLPTDINPTTAIPTYLTRSDTESIRALNRFNHTQSLTRDELKTISHINNDSRAVGGRRIAFNSILKLLQIQSPNVRWENIALLDTPGYSKVGAGVIETDEKTDAEKTREYLAKSDHLIWVVSAEDGTLHHSSVEFLRYQAKWKKPIHLLINKADGCNHLDEVVRQIRSDFESAGFKLAGWSAYSSVDAKVFAGDDPMKWLEAIDKKRKLTRWRGRFKDCITPIRQFCDQAKESCRSYVSLLAESGLKADFEADLAEKMSGLRKFMKGHQEKFETSIPRFDRFCVKLENQLDEVLKTIGITEETVADVAANEGVVAVYNGANYVNPDSKLLALHAKQKIRGIVSRYRNFDGCYITTPAATSDVHQITVSRKELLSHYANPQEHFAVGRSVELEVYEVSPHQKKVTFVAKPIL